MKRIVIAVALAATSAIGLAACGSSTSTTHKQSSGHSKQFAAARCMRTHGVSNFPDPQPGGGFSVSQAMGSTATVTVDNITFSGPEFERADKLCNPLSLNGGRPPISEQQKEKLIAFARCMRRHGLKQWGDPTFPPGGGIMQGGGPYSRSDPKVLSAAEVCNTRSG